MIEPIAPQGTDEWKRERCGHATMSEAGAILSKPKKGASGEAVTRRKLKVRVTTEQITGEPVESEFTNAHLDRGHQQEPLARMAYEASTGLLAVEVPFRRHPTIAWCGTSPDGEVAADGTVEIKCVMPHIQIDTILGGCIPSEHIPQVQGGLWVTGRRWCDFISYSPTLPGKLALCVYRVERDDDYIAALEVEVRRFLGEVEELRARLVGLAA